MDFRSTSGIAILRRTGESDLLIYAILQRFPEMGREEIDKMLEPELNKVVSGSS